MFTHVCPLCFEKAETEVANAVVSHDCPKNVIQRAKRTRDRKPTIFVAETKPVQPAPREDWVSTLSEKDQDRFMAMLAEDNLADTWKV